MDDPVTPSDLMELDSFPAPQKSPKGKFPDRDVSDVFAMAVEIENRKVGVLQARMNDNPENLANEFAQSHNLDRDQIDLLTEYITRNQKLLSSKRIDTIQEETLSSAHNGLGPEELKPERRTKDGPIQTHTTVHERLYQHRRKPASKEVPDPLPEKKNEQKANPNYGNWLYIRGVQSKEARTVASKKAKAETEKEKAKDLTFAPTINRVSSLMSPRIERKTEDLLFRKAAEFAGKVSELRLQKEQESLSECSFNPKIDPKSKKIASKRRTQGPDLFEDAAVRAKKKAQIAAKQIYPFRPRLTNLVYAKEDTQSFLTRISNSKKHFQAQIENVRQTLDMKRDPQTGQRLFRPLTAKTGPRSLSETSVHEHLYSLKDHKQQVRSQMALEIERHRTEVRNQSKLDTKSEKLYDYLKQKSYRRYFELLDGDRDGLISSGSCSVPALSPKVVSILSPVLTDIGEDPIAFPQFEDLMNSLLFRISPGEKAELLRKEVVPEIENLSRKVRTIQPSLCVKSEQLAQKHRQSLPGDIYERGMNMKTVRIHVATDAESR